MIEKLNLKNTKFIEYFILGKFTETKTVVPECNRKILNFLKKEVKIKELKRFKDQLNSKTKDTDKTNEAYSVDGDSFLVSQKEQNALNFIQNITNKVDKKFANKQFSYFVLFSFFDGYFKQRLLEQYYNKTRAGFNKWSKTKGAKQIKWNSKTEWLIEFVREQIKSAGRGTIVDQLKRMGYEVTQDEVRKYIAKGTKIGLSKWPPVKNRVRAAKNKDVEESARYVVCHHFLSDKRDAKGRLIRDFITSKSNQKWSIDISYVGTRRAPMYLFAIKDLHDKRVVAHEIDFKMDLAMVLRCLKRAIKENDVSELTINSDQGSVFLSKAYIDLLNSHSIKISHSRRGNCTDNAPVESLFNIIKVNTEFYNIIGRISRIELKLIIDKFIHFYNNGRGQLKLSWLSPMEKFRLEVCK